MQIATHQEDGCQRYKKTFHIKGPDIHFAPQSVAQLCIAKWIGATYFLILFKSVTTTLHSSFPKKSNGSTRGVKNRVKQSSCVVYGPDAVVPENSSQLIPLVL